MQKISSIHKLIQQILGSHEMIMPIFEQAHPKIIETTFGFPELELPCKKNQFNQFILEIQPILESCEQTGHTHF